MAVFVEYNNTVKALETGESCTITFVKNMALTDILVTFDTDGYLSYGGLVTVGQGGTFRKFACNKRFMSSEVVITAGKYGRADASHPIEVATEIGMDSILLNATQDSVGAVYKYIGYTSNRYEPGQLYIVARENT